VTADSPAVLVGLAGVLGALVLILLVVRALASGRRIERRLEAVQDELERTARNVALTLALTESAKRRHGDLEPVDKPLADGWQFTESAQAREGLLRWVEGGQRLLGVLARTLQDCDRLRADAETSMREVERLRGEVGRLRAENERFLQERGEIAQTLSRVVNDVMLPRRQS
jgi:HAMP domain-containing protein